MHFAQGPAVAIARGLPQPNAAISTARREGLAVRRKGDTKEGMGAHRGPPDALAVLQVPAAQVMRIGKGQKLAVGRVHQGLGAFGILLQGRQFFARCGVPETNGVAIAAGCQDLPVGRESQGAHNLRVALLGARSKAEPPASAGNPLSELPLERFSVTRERPIFLSSRRPPPPAPTYVAPASFRQPAKPPEPEYPAVSLLGTVIGTDVQIGVFLEKTTNKVVRLHLGEEHQGWVLRPLRWLSWRRSRTHGRCAY